MAWAKTFLPCVLLLSVGYCLPSPPSFAILEERACKVPANSINNGGFVDGLTGWNVTKVYNGSPGGPISCTASTAGYKSKNSAEISGSSLPTDSGNGVQLTQRFTLCKNETFLLSWAVYQVKKATKTGALAPSMQVSLFPPSSPFSGFDIADFDFGKTSYNASVYDHLPSDPQNSNSPAGVWTTYTSIFPTIETGEWKVDFQVFIIGDQSEAATDIRIDNVVVKPM